ncbi:uncharacterized protein TNCV_473161 [Trichonephila clavipes]|nr:uncharacterized protein TNCV_473161 [Trichonephila clavipes]
MFTFKSARFAIHVLQTTFFGHNKSRNIRGISREEKRWSRCLKMASYESINSKLSDQQLLHKSSNAVEHHLALIFCYPHTKGTEVKLSKVFHASWLQQGEKIELREDLKSRRGLAVSLEIICHNCGESTSTMSSKISNKCYDVNLRLTYGMRAIGKGGAAARIFLKDSMNAAVHEAVIANDNNSNIAVAVDGTWHKRGYSSLNGVVCATSVENGRLSTLKLSQNIVLHVRRSETSRKACYTQYLGDGDSKGFFTIKEAKIYGDTEVEKLECVGHVQKRMGTKLRNILKMSKGIKLSDGKNISGRGRLTLKESELNPTLLWASNP